MRDSKVIKDLIALAEGQQWTVITQKNGHIKFMPSDPAKKPVVSAGTHSTRRGIDNLKAALKRSGLKFPDNAGRPPVNQRERLLGEKVELLRQVVLDSLDHLRPTERDLAIIENAEPDILALLSLLIADDGRIHLDCPCGLQMHRLSGYMKHIGSCEQGHADIARRYAELDPEVDTVKRDMIHPPAREQLQCSECPDWFWVSQPHLLEQHMAGEHGMKKCPYCERWERMENGQISKHVNKCEKRPEGTPPVKAMVVPIGTARPARPARAATRPSPRPQLPTKPAPQPVGTSTSPAPIPPAVQPAAASPTPFVWRRPGSKVTATTYHYYTECGQVPTGGISPSEDAIEYVPVDGTMIELLGLHACRPCDRRSKEVTVEQMVMEWFSTMDEAADRDELALQFLVDLSEYGYKIVKGK